MSSSLEVQLYVSSVGSASTQITDSVPYPNNLCSEEISSRESVPHVEDIWIASFLAETKSMLPYKLPSLNLAPYKILEKESNQDWERLLCQISQPLISSMKCFLPEEAMGILKAMRSLSVATRESFSYAIRKLTIQQHCHIKQIVNSLRYCFNKVQSLHIKCSVGPIHASLRHCTQLRELCIEPVHFRDRHETESFIFGHLIKLEKLRLWGPIACTSYGMKSFLSLTSLKSLSLGSKLLISGEDLAHLSRCVRLQSLELFGCYSLDDIGLQHLGALTQLQELRLLIGRGSPLNFCNVSSVGIKSIAQLPHLQLLALTNFNTFTSKHLSALSVANGLRELKLEFPTAVCSMDFTPLGNIKQLISLSVRNVLLIDDRSIQICKEMRQLRILKIGNCSLATDTSATLLGRLPCLRELRMDEYPLLTEIGLESLIDNPSLESIRITGIYSISLEDIQDLVLNNSFFLDSESWRQQTINIYKVD